MTGVVTNTRAESAYAAYLALAVLSSSGAGSQ